MAALRHVSDEEPGIARHKRGSGFSYVWPDGRHVRDPKTLARIRAIVIPPAWTDVWISPRANGHIQATGRDQRKRKQHRYHPRWTAVRDEAKYARLLAFGAALPALRRRIRADLAMPGLPHRKVVALVVRLLEATFIRVGNDEYAKQNGSFGLTTILDRHATITGGTVRFRFRGKSGKDHEVALSDPRLARLVKQCRELAGSQLFQYVAEDRRVRDITSTDVNRYVREVMGQAFTAKDFRTWSGTVLAAGALSRASRMPEHVPGEPAVVAAIDTVAARLGNTRAVCRRCYVHPAVIDSYLKGTLMGTVGTAAVPAPSASRAPRRLETSVLRLLRRYTTRGRRSEGGAPSSRRPRAAVRSGR